MCLLVHKCASIGILGNLPFPSDSMQHTQAMSHRVHKTIVTIAAITRHICKSTKMVIRSYSYKVLRALESSSIEGLSSCNRLAQFIAS